MGRDGNQRLLKLNYLLRLRCGLTPASKLDYGLTFYRIIANAIGSVL